MPPKTVLDTDILSALMRRTPVVLNRARSYSAYHPKLTFSLITRYEILRGLKAKNATTQIASFHPMYSVQTTRFCPSPSRLSSGHLTSMPIYTAAVN